MKKFLILISAIIFNVAVGGMLSAASGISPTYTIVGGMALSALLPQAGGVLPMAVQKEIWISTLVEQLFATNSFLSKAFNADEFVSGKTVHIPNAGVPSGVVKNRNLFPAMVETRDDVDLTFDLDEYTTNPIKIPHADTVELNYNKRESVLRNDRAVLIESVSLDFILKWSPSSARVIRTTGGAVVAHMPSGTGNRKAFCKADLLAAMNRFNADDIPQDGRYVLVDAVMYGQLINDLTTAESIAFHSQVDVANGILGKLHSFNVMMRSKACKYTSALAPKSWDTAAAATDHGAVLAWHELSLCRAMGEVFMYDNPGDPLYYGDIYSFLVRAGGRPMRNDVKGLLAIVQDTAA